MEKLYVYEALIAKTTSAETRKFIIKGKTKINERIKIADVITKLYDRMYENELFLLEWSIIKLEKINGVTEKDYLELSPDNIIEDSLGDNSIKKFTIHNVSNVTYLIKFEFNNGKLIVSMTTNEMNEIADNKIIQLEPKKSIKLYPGKFFKVTEIFDRLLGKGKINKIDVINNSKTGESFYITKSVIEDINNQDTFLLSVYGDNDFAMEEVKFGEEKEIINMEN